MSETNETVVSAPIDRAPCQECAEEISVEASTCPECDYSPGSQGLLSGSACVFFGGLLSLTGIGALLGIPLALFGLVTIWATWGATPADVDEPEESAEKPWYMKSFVTLFREWRSS